MEGWQGSYFGFSNGLYKGLQGVILCYSFQYLSQTICPGTSYDSALVQA